MARLTAPSWLTAGGGTQVTSLPCMTVVTFTVTPRKSLNGFEIEYRLHSARLRVTPTTRVPPLPAEEAAGSSPGPDAIRRDDRVVIDRFENLTDATDVVRVLEIELSGSEKPAEATLAVTVFDLTKAGERVNKDEDSAGLSFMV